MEKFPELTFEAAAGNVMTIIERDKHFNFYDYDGIIKFGGYRGEE